MKRAHTGPYVTSSTAGETVRAFVPAPLPPSPSLVVDEALAHRLDRANIALGRLDGISGILPDTHLFLYAYVRKEAVLSFRRRITRSKRRWPSSSVTSTTSRSEPRR